MFAWITVAKLCGLYLISSLDRYGISASFYIDEYRNTGFGCFGNTLTMNITDLNKSAGYILGIVESSFNKENGDIVTFSNGIFKYKFD